MELSQDISRPNPVSRFLSKFRLDFRSVPLALLVLCILAYGLRLSRLGFYWDDWPWIWYSYLDGPAGMLKIDVGYRPLAGIILWVSSFLAGKSPLGWQILNLLYRWLTGLALWWACRKIWPGHPQRSLWVVLLFLVYPGFTQQFVAVNSSRHLFPLAVYFLSIGFMIRAIRERQSYGWNLLFALVLMAFSMLSTEYYYGLELIRPVILWLVAGPALARHLPRLKWTLKHWSPYLMLLAVIFIWRYVVAPEGNYIITITSDIAAQPLSATAASLRQVLETMVVSTAQAWGKVFSFPSLIELGRRYVVYYWGLGILTGCLAYLYLWALPDDETRGKFWLEALILGVSSLLVAGIPFIVTNLRVGLNFPDDRTTLPMMFGVSLIFAGLVDLLGRYRALRIGMIALALGLAVGMHFTVALSYERDWTTQKSFFRQLAERIPGLAPGTSVFYEYTTALRDHYFTDNSLSAPLNWLYSPQLTGNQVRYLIFDLRQRTGSAIPALESGLTFDARYGQMEFPGSTDQALAILFAPPWCMQVLYPEYDGLYPHLPDNLAQAVRLSRPELININSNAQVNLPPEIFGASPSPDWCDYYQMADLARQRGDWQRVMALGDKAFAIADYPKQPAERILFIQGYGYGGRWERAEALTIETIKRDLNTSPMLCTVWEQLAVETPGSPEKSEVLGRVRARLKCKDS